MKKKLTPIIFLILAILFTSISFLQAQITIQSDEYDISLGTKLHLYFAVDSLGTGYDVSVGTTDGPQTWNFTLEQFPDGETAEFTVVDPATTPYSEFFPDADHAWENLSQGDTIITYQYFNLTSSDLFFHGMVLHNPDTAIFLVPEPAESMISFPVQMGASWTNSYSQTIGIEMFEVVEATNSNLTVDAWGNINIPAGNFECLRIREDKTEISTFYFFGTPLGSDTSTYISYTWVGETYGILASVTSDSNETDPNFTQAYDVTLRSSVETRVDDNFNTAVNTFELFYNYPNPFNPATIISYHLDQATNVELIIYNSVGEEVATFIQEYQSPGVHKVEWNAHNQPSGLYFCNLKTNQNSAIHKMVLLK